MLRRILWLLPLVLLAAHALLGVGPDQFRQGYDQAVQDLGKVREKMGWASDTDPSLLDRVQYLPPLPDKPDTWKRGYRQAVKDQLEQNRLR